MIRLFKWWSLSSCYICGLMPLTGGARQKTIKETLVEERIAQNKKKNTPFPFSVFNSTLGTIPGVSHRSSLLYQGTTIQNSTSHVILNLGLRFAEIGCLVARDFLINTSIHIHSISLYNTSVIFSFSWFCILSCLVFPIDFIKPPCGSKQLFTQHFKYFIFLVNGPGGRCFFVKGNDDCLDTEHSWGGILGTWVNMLLSTKLFVSCGVYSSLPLPIPSTALQPMFFLSC